MKRRNKRTLSTTAAFQGEHFKVVKFGRKKYSLSFRDKNLEEDFNVEFYQRYQTRWRLAMGASFIAIVLAIVIYGTAEYEYGFQRYILLGWNGVVLIVYIIILILSLFKFFFMKGKWGRTISYFLTLVPPTLVHTMLMLSWSFVYCFDASYGSPLCTIPIFLLTISQPGVKIAIIFVIFQVAGFLIIPVFNPRCFFVQDDPSRWLARFIVETFQTVFTGVIALVFNFNVETQHRKLFELNKRIMHKKEMLKKQNEIAHKLIKNIIPKDYVKKVESVIRRRRRDEFRGIYRQSPSLNPILCEQQQCLTIFMCDFVNFTMMSDTLSSRKLVKMLNVLYSSFDKQCTEWSVEKIKTIGDAHFSLIFDTGDPKQRQQSCLKMVNMALGFLKALKNLNEKFNWDFNLRGGISQKRGHICVLGESQITFDVFGEVKIITEMLESSARTNYIQVDSSVKEATGAFFDYSEPHTLEHPVIGTFDAYYLLSEHSRFVDQLHVGEDSHNTTLSTNSTEIVDSYEMTTVNSGAVPVPKTLKQKVTSVKFLTKMLGTYIDKTPGKRKHRMFQFELNKFKISRKKLMSFTVFLALYDMIIFSFMICMLLWDKRYNNCEVWTSLILFWPYVMANYNICIHPGHISFTQMWFFFSWTGLWIIQLVICGALVLFLLFVDSRERKHSKTTTVLYFLSFGSFIISLVLFLLKSWLVYLVLSTHLTLFICLSFIFIIFEVLSCYFVPHLPLIVAAVFLVPGFFVFDTNTTSKVLSLLIALLFFMLELIHCTDLVTMSKLKRALKKEIRAMKKEKRNNLQLLMSFLPESLITATPGDQSDVEDDFKFVPSYGSDLVTLNVEKEDDEELAEDEPYTVLANSLTLADSLGKEFRSEEKGYLQNNSPNEVHGYICFCKVEGFERYFFDSIKKSSSSTSNMGYAAKRKRRREENVEPLNFLNSLFTQFDRYCEREQIIKIKNHGHIYLCTVWIHSRDEVVPQCKKIVKMATRFQEIFGFLTRSRNKMQEKSLSLKTGIHMGKFSTAIVGLTKFHFDVFGSTVNIASRISDQSKKNMVFISEEILNLLNGDPDFSIKNEGGFEMKGVGCRSLYSVENNVRTTDSEVRELLMRQSEQELSFDDHAHDPEVDRA